jgi:hypothetical protein
VVCAPATETDNCAANTAIVHLKKVMSRSSWRVDAAATKKAVSRSTGGYDE